MNAEIGLKAVPGAQFIAKNNSDRPISWKIKQRDGVESTIRCLQVLTDVSGVGECGIAGILFFAKTLLNFSEEIRWRHVVTVQ